jgi:hypothetical protein
VSTAQAGRHRRSAEERPLKRVAREKPLAVTTALVGPPVNEARKEVTASWVDMRAGAGPLSVKLHNLRDLTPICKSVCSTIRRNPFHRFIKNRFSYVKLEDGTNH